MSRCQTSERWLSGSLAAGWNGGNWGALLTGRFGKRYRVQLFTELMFHFRHFLAVIVNSLH